MLLQHTAVSLKPGWVILQLVLADTQAGAQEGLLLYKCSVKLKWLTLIFTFFFLYVDILFHIL